MPSLIVPPFFVNIGNLGDRLVISSNRLVTTFWPEYSYLLNSKLGHVSYLEQDYFSGVLIGETHLIIGGDRCLSPTTLPNNHFLENRCREIGQTSGLRGIVIGGLNIAPTAPGSGIPWISGFSDTNFIRGSGPNSLIEKEPFGNIFQVQTGTWISVWVSYEDDPNDGTLSRRAIFSKGGGFRLEVDRASLRPIWLGTTIVNTRLEFGSPTHIFLIKTGLSWDVYVDGTYRQTVFQEPSDDPDPNAFLTVGQRNGTNRWSGSIALLKFGTTLEPNPQNSANIIYRNEREMFTPNTNFYFGNNEILLNSTAVNKRTGRFLAATHFDLFSAEGLGFGKPQRDESSEIIGLDSQGDLDMIRKMGKIVVTRRPATVQSRHSISQPPILRRFSLQTTTPNSECLLPPGAIPEALYTLGANTRLIQPERYSYYRSSTGTLILNSLGEWLNTEQILIVYHIKQQN